MNSYKEVFKSISAKVFFFLKERKNEDVFNNFACLLYMYQKKR